MMRNELSKEVEQNLIARIESKFKSKTSKTIVSKDEKEESVFWYDPKMIPLSHPLNYKKK